LLPHRALWCPLKRPMQKQSKLDQLTRMLHVQVPL
jgi:hypothetical protein